MIAGAPGETHFRSDCGTQPRHAPWPAWFGRLGWYCLPGSIILCAGLLYEAASGHHIFHFHQTHRLLMIAASIGVVTYWPAHAWALAGSILVGRHLSTYKSRPMPELIQTSLLILSLLVVDALVWTRWLR